MFTDIKYIARCVWSTRIPFASIRALRVVPVFLLFAIGMPAKATTVGCSGAPSGTYDFATLTSAIAAAPLSNNSITIYGTCTETVVITGAQNLTLAGAAGSVLSDPGSGNAVLDFESSQNVTLQNLKIQMASYTFYGPTPGILVDSSTLVIRSCDIEGAAGTDGIDINTLSNVLMLGNNLIENNNDGQGDGEGINLTGPAANVQIGNGPGGGDCTTIQGNGDDGILAANQAAVTVVTYPSTCAKFQNNGSFGVQISQDSTGHLANRGNVPTLTLSNNFGGVSATNYGVLALNGVMLIQDNSATGIWVRDATASVSFAGNGPGPGPTVQQNGSISSPPCCVIPGGISVEGNSHLSMGAVVVSNNAAPGIVIDDDSSAEIANAGSSVAITNNPLGVSVMNDSSLRLEGPSTITGNANGDLVCSGFSTAHGDASGVGRMRCDTFIPGPGGRSSNGHHGAPW